MNAADKLFAFMLCAWLCPTAICVAISAVF